MKRVQTGETSKAKLKTEDIPVSGEKEKADSSEASASVPVEQETTVSPTQTGSARHHEDSFHVEESNSESDKAPALQRFREAIPELSVVDAETIRRLGEPRSGMQEALQRLRRLGLDPPDALYSDSHRIAEVAVGTNRYPEVVQRVLELVIGEDDRRQVEEADQYPWRCICALYITAKDASQWKGTGWLAGPRLVVTCGHVVYMHEKGGWVSSIRVVPAVNGESTPPFGSFDSRDFRSVSGWVHDRRPASDYGAILLPQDVGLSAGYLGYGYLPEDHVEGLVVNLSGYPSDKPAATQWYNARIVNEVDNSLLFYNIDTAGGQSGSPVWANVDGERYVIGIHTGGSLTGNSAVHVTPEICNNIAHWNVGH